MGFFTKPPKASPKQMAYLATYMRRHPKLQIPAASEDRAQWEMDWSLLANKLNTLDGAMKSVQKWKQTWRDLRNNWRKKQREKMQNRKKVIKKTEPVIDEKEKEMIDMMLKDREDQILPDEDPIDDFVEEETLEPTPGSSQSLSQCLQDPEIKEEIIDIVVTSEGVQPLPKKLQPKPIILKRSNLLKVAPQRVTFHQRKIKRPPQRCEVSEESSDESCGPIENTTRQSLNPQMNNVDSLLELEREKVAVEREKVAAMRELAAAARERNDIEREKLTIMRNQTKGHTEDIQKTCFSEEPQNIVYIEEAIYE